MRLCYCWHLMQGWQELLNFQPLIQPTSLELCGFFFFFLPLSPSFSKEEVPMPWIPDPFHLLPQGSSSTSYLLSYLIWLTEVSIEITKIKLSILITKIQLFMVSSAHPPCFFFFSFHSQTSQRVVSIHSSSSSPSNLSSAHLKWASLSLILCSKKPAR